MVSVDVSDPELAESATTWKGDFFIPTPDSSWIIQGDAIPNPSATVAIDNVASTGSTEDPERFFALLLYPHSSKLVEVDLPDDCFDVGWWTDHEVFCLRESDISLIRFEEDYSRAELLDLLPSNDRTNVMPVGSPDESEFAFISCRAGDCGVFIASRTGGEPLRIHEDAPGEHLVQWRSAEGQSP